MADNCPGGVVPRYDANSCVKKVTIALAVELADVLAMAVNGKICHAATCSKGGSCAGGGSS